MKVIVQGFGVVGAATALNIVSSNNFKNNINVHCIEKNSQEGKRKIQLAEMLLQNLLLQVSSTQSQDYWPQ